MPSQMQMLLERMLKERSRTIILRLEDDGRMTVEEKLESVVTDDDAAYASGGNLHHAVINCAKEMGII